MSLKFPVECLLTALILVISVHEALSLHCYVCNSHQDGRCKDPFNNVTQKTENCDSRRKMLNLTYIDNYVDRGTTDKMYCRKIYQEIEDNERWIRDCAFIEDDAVKSKDENDRCIQRAGSFHIKYETCYCNKNGCNVGSDVKPAFLAISLLTIVSLLPFTKS